MCGDIAEAFLHVGIRECERNILRFCWVWSELCGNKQVTRLVFGLTQSLFVLEATLKAHFYNYMMNYLKVIEKIWDDIYVDDLTSVGNIVGEVEILK